jgi:hypothetical protein
MMLCDKCEFIFTPQIQSSSMRDLRKFFGPSGEKEIGFSSLLSFRWAEIVV